MIPRHLVIAMSVLMVAVLALTIYALHMRKTAAATPVAATDTRPLAPPVAGPTERVTLYVAHDDDGTLRAESARIPLPSGRQQRAEAHGETQWPVGAAGCLHRITSDSPGSLPGQSVRRG